ncbi:MAG TPA: thioesterase family protein [Gemmatimonadales bacterium]|nr:thioesterase family protein [Gemmatimonadales bacterium]
MNLIFRVLAVLWRYLWDHRRTDPLAPSVLSFRVLPNDLDPNWHMNNGRYLTIMDLGRLDMTLHSGLMRAVITHRWMPVLGGATIAYQRPLAPFQRYTLTTRILGWDEKWIYMEQVFDSQGKRAATAMVRALIRGREKSVPTAEVMRSVGLDTPSPPLPPQLRAWIESDATLRATAAG